MNILVLPGTTGIAREIFNSLCQVKNIQLFGAGFDLEKSLEFTYVRFDALAPWDEIKTLTEVEFIVQKNNIDLIILAHDEWISNTKNLDIIGRAKIIKSNSRAISIALQKSKTYDHFRNLLPCPIVFRDVSQIKTFPVYLKPDRGQGSVGAKAVADRNSLQEFLNYDGSLKPNWIISEYLPGKEYTIDCFSDKNFQVRYVSVRIRSKINNGLAVETQVIHDDKLYEWANIISNELSLIGAWFFQAKEDLNGNKKILEIGLRIAGGSGIQRLKGVNLSLLNILLEQNQILKIIDQNVFPKIAPIDLGFIYENIYVDFDDTLILNGSINTYLMSFLEDSKRNGHKIILISRNSSNLLALIDEFGLINFFSEIIRVLDNQLKSSMINTDQNFIFIDDSFKERYDVLLKYRSQVLVLDETAFVR